jgi:hypothetical protein
VVVSAEGDRDSYRQMEKEVKASRLVFFSIIRVVLVFTLAIGLFYATVMVQALLFD